MDYFDLVGLSRRPWLDPLELKARLHSLTASSHPDAGGEERKFVEINRARAVLQDDAARLKHLLELEAPSLAASGGSSIPGALAEKFMRIAVARQKAEAFLRGPSATGGALFRALAESERSGHRVRLASLIEDIDADRLRSICALRDLDARWLARTEADLIQLAEVHRELLFIQKCLSQLRELLLHLDL